jgi:hypothetical protein
LAALSVPAPATAIGYLPAGVDTVAVVPSVGAPLTTPGPSSWTKPLSVAVRVGLGVPTNQFLLCAVTVRCALAMLSVTVPVASW